MSYKCSLNWKFCEWGRGDQNRDAKKQVRMKLLRVQRKKADLDLRAYVEIMCSRDYKNKSKQKGY